MVCGSRGDTAEFCPKSRENSPWEGLLEWHSWLRSAGYATTMLVLMGARRDAGVPDEYA